MSIHYIMEGNIFVVIVCKLKQQQKLKCHIKDCFKTNGKQTIKMPKKDEFIKFKNYERKIKSPVMIYAGF